MCRPFSQLVQDVQYSSLGLVLIGALATLNRIVNALLAAKDSDKIGGEFVLEMSCDPLETLEDIGELVDETNFRATANAKLEIASSPMSRGGVNLDDHRCAKSAERSRLTSSDSAISQNIHWKRGDDSCGLSNNSKLGNSGNSNVIDDLFQALL